MMKFIGMSTAIMMVVAALLGASCADEETPAASTEETQETQEDASEETQEDSSEETQEEPTEEPVEEEPTEEPTDDGTSEDDSDDSAAIWLHLPPHAELETNTRTAEFIVMEPMYFYFGNNPVL